MNIRKAAILLRNGLEKTSELVGLDENVDMVNSV